MNKNFKNNNRLLKSLEIFLLASKVRELSYSPIPINYKRIILLKPIFLIIFKLMYPPLQRNNTKGKNLLSVLYIQLINNIIFLSEILTLIFIHILIWNLRRPNIFKNVIYSIYKKLNDDSYEHNNINGYIYSSKNEDPLIEACLVARSANKHGIYADILIKRFKSDLPNLKSKSWLSFFLAEIGNEKDSKYLNSIILQESSNIKPNYIEKYTKANLNYGIVIAAMFDSPTFQSSVNSILNSDFNGDIVVAEDGRTQNKNCEEFCKSIGVKYIKNKSWQGISGTLNIGIDYLDPKTDIVIIVHSDVLWPNYWFKQLDTAWSSVHKYQKIAQIGLGYVQFRAGTDSTTKELFNQGEYDHLVKILKSSKDFDRLTKKIDDVQIHDPSLQFGLNREPWHDNPHKIRFMTGKTCIAASFPKKYWEGFGKYDSSIPFGHEGEMQINAARDKKWTIYFNNPPLIHMRSDDTHRLNKEEKNYFSNMMNNTHPKFEEKYGWKLDHFELTNFSEVRIIHYKEITNAINKMDFDSIDYIFEELFQRLKSKVLSNCEHNWCPSRSVCTYI